MQKMINNVMICLILACVFWLVTLFTDRNCLNDELIRLHVVANSDTEEDQQVKLQVKDAIVDSLKVALKDVSDVEEAKQWIGENLLLIQNVANEALACAGSSDQAVVSMCKEIFDTRYYDTFTLPAGAYQSLRITIGNGDGHNWWCVAFPSLCVPVTTEGFETAAAGAGFSDTLSSTLEQKEGYEVRFFLLDMMGRVQNIFFTE